MVRSLFLRCPSTQVGISRRSCISQYFWKESSFRKFVQCCKRVIRKAVSELFGQASLAHASQSVRVLLVILQIFIMHYLLGWGGIGVLGTCNMVCLTRYIDSNNRWLETKVKNGRSTDECLIDNSDDQLLPPTDLSSERRLMHFFVKFYTPHKIWYCTSVSQYLLYKQLMFVHTHYTLISVMQLVLLWIWRMVFTLRPQTTSISQWLRRLFPGCRKLPILERS
jgi:hypothetical protein